MSLVLVHDSTNSKVKALECDANGLLKVDVNRPENNIFHLSNYVFIKKTNL